MADDSRYPKLYATRPGSAPGAEPEPGPAAEPPRDAAGTLLKRTREAYGQDLRQVSEALRIRYAYLDAIERSAFEELPGPTYAIGFVRGYAQYLGLDDDEIVRRFKEESQGLKQGQELHFPAPVNEGKLPGASILIVSVVLIVAAYGAWSFLSSDTRSVADLVPEVPQRLQELVGADQAPAPPDAPDLTQTDGAAEDSWTGTQAADANDAGGGGDAPSGAAGSDTAAGETEKPTGDGDGAGATGAGTARPQTAETQTAETQTADTQTADRTADDAGADEPSGTASGGADAADGGAPSAPDAGGQGGGQSGRQSGETVASVPDAPSVPSDSDGGASPDAGTAAPGAEPGSDDNAGDAAEGTGGSGRAEADGEGSAGETAPATETAQRDAAGNDGGPPAVPDMQQDDSGIPTAPGQEQTASTQPEGRSFGADPGNSRLTLRATARSWVQVRGPDDSLVLTRMLRPGDVYRVPDRQGLTLHTGNAGGLEVLVDGKSLGSLGDDGEVRRGIVLEPGAFGG